jgi:hypothetical protein
MEPAAIPRSTADSVRNNDCAMKSCNDARTWRVATTPSAVNRKSAPVKASRAEMIGKDELVIMGLDF